MKNIKCVLLSVVAVFTLWTASAQVNGELSHPSLSIQFYDALNTSDGGILFVGEVEKKDTAFIREEFPDYFEDIPFGGARMLLHKVDKNGNVSWTKTYLGLVGKLIQQYDKSTYLVAGYRNPPGSENPIRPFVYGIGLKGERLWYKELDTKLNSTPESMFLLPNKRTLLLCDYKYSKKKAFTMNPYTIRLVKLEDENVILDKEIPDAYDKRSFIPTEIAINLKSQIFISGTTFIEEEELYSPFIIELDRSNNVSNNAVFGEFHSEVHWNAGMSLINDGIVMIGQNTTKGHISMFCLDFELKLVWEKQIEADPYVAPKLLITKNDEIYCATTDEDKVLMLRKYTNKGNLLWTKSYPEITKFTLHQLLLSNNGELILVGTSDNEAYIKDNSGAYYKLTKEGELLNTGK